jgi:hypothetical protein
MNIIRTISILIIPLLLVTGIAPIGVVYADKPTDGTGTISPVWDPYVREYRGNSCSYTQYRTGTVVIQDSNGLGIDGEGTVEAFFSAEDCTAPIRYTYKTIYTFDEVTIAGRTGGAVIINDAHGTVMYGPIPPIVYIYGNLRLVSSTGGLEGLHLVGKFWLTPEVFPNGQYEIRTHFDP